MYLLYFTAEDHYLYGSAKRGQETPE